MKKLIFTLLLSISSIYVWAQGAQDSEQSTQKAPNSTQGAKNDEHKDHADRLKTMPVKPPNYGSLMIDWGFNALEGHPAAMNLNLLGSRSASVSLFYNIRLGNAPFVISPGIGLSFDAYQFADKENILVRDEENRNNTELKRAITLFPKSTSRVKSAFSMRYLALMLEARFNFNNRYPKEGFFVVLGGKLGVLLRASTTVKYEEDNETKRQYNVEKFNLNGTRGGFYTRLGWGRFGLCYTYMLASLFKTNQGPDNSNIKTHSLALSIDFF